MRRMQRRSFLSLLGLAACSPARNDPSVVDIAPAKDGPTASASATSLPQKLVIGELASFTGDLAEFGDKMRRGVDLAIDELNGASDTSYEIEIGDDRSKADWASRVATKLIEERRVVALVGEVASALTKPAAVVASRERVPIISPASTSPQIPAIGPFVFAACFDDDAQGAYAARFLVKELGKTKLGIIYASDMPYSAGIAAAFKAALQKTAATLVVEKTISKDAKNLGSAVQDLSKAAPERIFAPLYFDQMRIVATEARAAGMSADVFFGSDSWTGDDVLLDLLAGAQLLDHWHVAVPYPRAKRFASAYEEKTGMTPDSIAALSYDAMHLLANAVNQTENATSDEIRDALAKTNDFSGASGSITFDDRRRVIKPAVVLRVQNRACVFDTVVSPG